MAEYAGNWRIGQALGLRKPREPGLGEFPVATPEVISPRVQAMGRAAADPELIKAQLMMAEYLRSKQQ